jgi:hypothetical protein
MPQAADITVDNASAVAKTFTLLSPAAGYGSIAEWALKEGTISSVFPRLTALARSTGNRSKKSQIKLKVPSSYTDSVTGLTKVGSAFEADISVSVPDDFPEDLKDDAVAFTQGVVANAIIEAMMRDGLPAN